MGAAVSVRILRGDARSLPLPDGSADLVVTSPPYFGLRSYQDGGEHYAGQVGAEPTPAEFVTALLECTREMMRVLKPSGSIWVNLGDKYARTGGGGVGSSDGAMGRNGTKISRTRGSSKAPSLPDSAGMPRGGVGETYTPVGRPATVATGAREKSLIGIPWRYALACIDDLGLILRAEVIWSKPNGLPESVTDRVRRSHEQWFHFTKSPQYYSAVDDIREPHARLWDASNAGGFTNRKGAGSHMVGASDRNGQGYPMPHPLGKLPGSVWEIPSQPLTVPAHLGVDHFAAFPMEWPRRIISGWSPREVCTGCGEGRWPVGVSDPGRKERDTPAYGAGNHGKSSTLGSRGPTWTMLGHACACPDTSAPAIPGVVCDPFGGTGTTALVADALGRQGISVDMSADYCRLAGWRTTDPTEMAQARGRRLPPELRPMPGQVDMFDGAA